MICRRISERPFRLSGVVLVVCHDFGIQTGPIARTRAVIRIFTESRSRSLSADRESLFAVDSFASIDSEDRSYRRASEAKALRTVAENHSFPGHRDHHRRVTIREALPGH